jgi:hypothetical protein
MAPFCGTVILTVARVLASIGAADINNSDTFCPTCSRTKIASFDRFALKFRAISLSTGIPRARCPVPQKDCNTRAAGPPETILAEITWMIQFQGWPICVSLCHPLNEINYAPFSAMTFRGISDFDQNLHLPA